MYPHFRERGGKPQHHIENEQHQLDRLIGKSFGKINIRGPMLGAVKCRRTDCDFSRQLFREGAE